MGRKLATLILPAVMGCSSTALALGLGGIEADSALNEPLDARIPLRSASPAELESLRFSLASPEAFERAGVSRPFFLSRLQFNVVTEAGPPYVEVTTADPVKEPFLDFLVEARWPRGTLMREYTVLLDPPVYADQSAPAAPRSSAPATSQSSEAEQASGATAAAPANSAAEPEAAPAEPSRGGSGSYGPVQSSDTLYRIANRIRPDDISPNQAMLALLRTNPDAFMRDNINRLQRGAVLRIPDREEFTRLAAADAAAEVREQMALWRRERDVVTATAEAENALDGAATEEAAARDDARTGDAAEESGAEPRSELKVVAPENSTGEDATTSAEAQDSRAIADEELRSRLTMLEEVNASLESENRDLAEQVESMKRDLGRLESMVNLQMQESMADSRDAEAAGEGAEPAVEGDSAMVAEGTEASTSATDAGPVESPTETENDDAGSTTADAAEPAAEPDAGSDSAAATMAVADREPEAEPETQPGVMESLLRDRQLLMVAGGGGVLLLLLLLLMQRRRAAARGAAAGELDPLPAGAPTGMVVDADAREGFDAVPAEEAPERLPESSYEEPEREAAAARVTPLSDEDPLEQVEVYVALGNLEKGQAVLDEALGEDPDNRELRFRLLELLAERGDRGGFEAEAQVFHTQVDTEADPLWGRVVDMGRRIAPEHPLFGEPESDFAVGAEPAAAEANDGGHDDGAHALPATNASTQEAQPDGAVEFDFDVDPGTDSRPEPGQDAGREADDARPVAPIFDATPDDDTDFDLDFVLDEADRTPTREADTSSAAVADDGDLDFDLPDDLQSDGDDEALVAAEAAADLDDDYALDFGDIDSSRPEATAVTEGDVGDEDFDLDALDETGTKLDLARAYIDMGDADGARSLLDEVLDEGDDGQRREAQVLLEQAG